MNKQHIMVMICMFVSQPLGLIALQEVNTESWDADLSESEPSERSFLIHTQEYEVENDDVTELSEDSFDEFLMRDIDDGSLDQRNLRDLIDQGANIHQDNDAPLRRAVQLGNVLIVRMLLHSGANIHVLQGEVLKDAISSNQRDVVEEILTWSTRRDIGCFSASLIYELYEKVINMEDIDDGFQQTEIAMLLEVYLDLLRKNLSYIDDQLITEIAGQEILEVLRLLGQQANVHTGGGLLLTIAVIKKDAALVELLLEHAQPSRQGLFFLHIVKNCIKLVKEKTPESDEIFKLLQCYLQEYWSNLVSISNYEMLGTILENDPLLLNRWLTIGADIHYAQDELLSNIVNLGYHEIIESLLSWSLQKDQILYPLDLIHKLIEEAAQDLVVIAMLEKYEKTCRILLQPER